MTKAPKRSHRPGPDQGRPVKVAALLALVALTVVGLWWINRPEPPPPRPTPTPISAEEALKKVKRAEAGYREREAEKRRQRVLQGGG